MWHIPRSKISESYGSSSFNFWGIPMLIPIEAVSVYIPTSSVQRFIFLHVHSNTWYLLTFNLFMYLLTICMSSSEKNLVPLTNFNYIVCFVVVVYLSLSYILDSIFQIYGLQIFHSIGYFFILSFALQKSFRLM